MFINILLSPDLGRSIRSRRATVVPSGGVEIVLGQDGDCEADDSTSCNGPLRANTRYK